MFDGALVEKVARAMCESMGQDPNQLVPITGYSHDRNNCVAQWMKHTEYAVRHIAAAQVLGTKIVNPD